MDIKFKSLLIGFIPAALYFLYATSFSKKAKQKLYTATFTIAAEPDTSSTKKSTAYPLIKYFEKRLQNMGLLFSIEEKGPDKLEIQIEHVRDTQRISAGFFSPSIIQFWETYNVVDLEKMMRALIDTLPKLLTEKKLSPKIIHDTSLSPSIRALIDSLENPNTGTEWLDFMDINQSYVHERLGEIVHPGMIAQIRIKDSALLRRLVDDFRLKHLLPEDAVLCWGTLDKDQTEISYDKKILGFYFLKTRMRTKAFLENEDILEASAAFDLQGRVEIYLNFKRHSVFKWSNLTETNIGRCIAIVLDGKVVTSPIVESRIEEGSSRISGTFSFDEAVRISEQLTVDKAPADVRLIHSSFSLQKPDINMVTTGLISLGLVAGFSVLAYIILRILIIN